MKSSKIDVAFGIMDIDGLYYLNIMTVCSEIFSHTNTKVHLHILHDETLSTAHIEEFRNFVISNEHEISFYDVSKDRKLDQAGKISMCRGMLYRLCMFDYCLNVDKMIYLDCDVLVTGDISKLWKFDISNYYIGVVKDMPYTRDVYINNAYYRKMGLSPELYFNSGVLLINLSKIREDFDVLSELEKFATKYPHCAMLDQDFLNCVFKNNVLYLSEMYNFIPENVENLTEKDIEANVIIHFAGPFKPWNCRNPIVIEYFCRNFANIFEKEKQQEYIIKHMSKLPKRHFERLGLRHALLQYDKSTLKQNKFIITCTCFLKGILPDKVFRRLAYDFMIKFKIKILYSFYYCVPL